MNPSDYDKNPGIGEINFDTHASPGERWRDSSGKEAMRWQTSTGQATNDNAASAWDWQRIIAALVCMGVCVIVWAMLAMPLLAWVRGLV